MSLAPRSNVLGNANEQGYARIVRKLGDIDVGNGVKQPISLVFTSNPMFSPGMFGPGWRFPLFDSVVVQYDKGYLYWDAPDEFRYFFGKDEKSRVRQGEDIYQELGMNWNATVKRNGEIVITGKNDPLWLFLYRDGRLRQFRLGANSEIFHVSYHHRGWPLQVTSQVKNRVIFFVEYSGGIPKSLLVGDRHIQVGMGNGQMIAPDGRTKYQSSSTPFLRSLAWGQEEQWEFTYTQSNTNEQEEIVSRGPSKKPVTRMRTIPLNCLKVAGLSGNQSMVEWESTSGFVVADSGGSYSVSNIVFDPHRNLSVSGRSPVPGMVKISRILEDGREQVWSYDPNSGIRRYEDVNGVQIRDLLIMTPGVNASKLRKREVLRDGQWVTTQQNIYNSNGHLIRSIEEGTDFQWKREERGGYVYEEQWINGRMVGSAKKTHEGKLIEEILYDPNVEDEIFMRPLSLNSEVRGIIRTVSGLSNVYLHSMQPLMDLKDIKGMLVRLRQGEEIDKVIVKDDFGVEIMSGKDGEITIYQRKKINGMGILFIQKNFELVSAYVSYDEGRGYRVFFGSDGKIISLLDENGKRLLIDRMPELMEIIFNEKERILYRYEDFE